MKNLKKITAIVLVILMLVSTTSCFSRSEGSGGSVNGGGSVASDGFDNNFAEDNSVVEEDRYGDVDKEEGNIPDKDNRPDNNGQENINKEPTIDYPDDFEGDIVIGSKYFDGENVENINNKMHLIYVEEDGSFILDSIEVGSWSTGISERCGKSVYDPTSGIYTLTFDGDGTVAYGRMDGTVFMFCNKDGSDIETISGRGGDGVTEIAIDARAGNSDYGYKDLSKNTNGDEMQRLYRELLGIYEELYESDKDIPAEESRYVLARIALDDYELSIDEMVSVWKIFGLENPAYYYYYNTLYVEDDNLVLCIDPDYALASERKKYEADIKAMEKECAQLLEGKNTELLRIMAVHDYIVTEINYAYETDGKTPEDASWAHNIIGVSTKASGVCESYAKTFQYLCLINGIEAITISGYGGEPHGWNLAKVNGNWYCFDATWNDTGDNDKLSYDCFGLSFSNMTASHTHDMPTDYGVSYLYDIPTVCNYDIQLVTLYEDGVSLGLFCGIDDTFAYMTNKDAEYTVELYNYSDTGPLLASSPMIKHYIYSEKTPDVKKISIEGTYKSFDGGYIKMTPIYLVNIKGFTVTADFSISDMEFINPDFFRFPGMFLDNSSLTFTGSGCESEITLIGRTDSDTSSTIISDTMVTVYSDVDVHRIEAGPYFHEQQSHITLRSDVNVDEVELSILNLTQFLGHYKANIGTFKGVGEYPGINFDNYDATIGDIIIDDVAEKVSLGMNFSDLSEVSHISLTGKVNGPIEMRLDGQKSFLSTDMEGNELENWIEKADPLDIEKPFLRINQSIDFESISVKFVEWIENSGGYHIDKTVLYELDASNNLILGEFTKTADGSIVKGNTLVRYNGSEATPTIPAGVTRIATHAFFDRSSITSVVLPEGITFVGKDVFSGCPNMKSLSLPSTLTEFDVSAVAFGDINGERTVNYNGTAKQWRELAMRALAAAEQHSLNVSTVICTDGEGIVYSPFARYGEYPDYLFGDQWFEYTDTDGASEIRYAFQYDGNGRSMLIRYSFRANGSTSSTSLSETEESFEYEYSNDKKMFSVDVDGKMCYLKVTDSGFVFCDADGNTLTELP